MLNPRIMKSKVTFFKLMSFAMMLTLIVLVIVACKKKDANDTPVPPGPTPLPAAPTVFTNRPLHMMSDDEIANNVEFPGHIINRMGNGLVKDEAPDIDNPFKDIKDLVSAISDYKKSKTDFNNTNNALTQINSQISVLQKSITNLTTDLKLATNALENYMTATAILGYITNIKECFSDVSSTQSLMYFSSEGMKYQANQLPAGQIQLDSTYATEFPQGIFPYGGGGPRDAYNNINQLNSLLIPTPGLELGNALDTYTSEIITLATPLKVSDSATMMKVYRLLENYFLQVVNYQFQAVACYMNAANMVDTNGYNANLYYTGGFRQDIIQEINSFLVNVDRLVINVSDYRDTTRFKNDMQYALAGLAPDINNINVLARAQFISCMLYDALGLPYPVVSGYMITPGRYNSAGTLNAPSVAVTIGSVPIPMDTVPKQITSQIPYTYWAGSPPACEPDTNWNIYRFGTLGKYYGTFPTTSQTVTVGAPPWVNYTAITGSVTPLYYNPQNPNQHSNTSSSTYTFEFAYFSANWQWGYLQLTNSPTGWFKTTDNLPMAGYFDLTSFNSSIARRSVNVPSASTSNSKGELTTQTSGIAWTNTYNIPIPGFMQCGGTTGTTSNYYVIIDGNLTNVKTGNNVPQSGGSIQAWAWYKVNYNMQGTGGNDLTVNIATFRSEQQWPSPGYYIYTIGNDVVRTNWHDQAGSTTWNSGFGRMTSLKTNTAYQPGIQYYYQTANLTTAATASITLYSGYQFVYMGTH